MKRDGVTEHGFGSHSCTPYTKEFMNQALLDKIESEQFRKDDANFDVGDTVRVHTKVVEGDKERIQIFAGVVIGRRGRGLNETFTVRRISYGEGVERIFPLHSPRVDKIEVERQGDVRRAKLTYLRKRIGKGATLVKEKEEKVEAARRSNSAEHILRRGLGLAFFVAITRPACSEHRRHTPAFPVRVPRAGHRSPFLRRLDSQGDLAALVSFPHPAATRCAVLLLNYAYEEDPPMGIQLLPGDEPNRACIQLYHHVATQAALRGKNVLEVSCGHGGGAAISRAPCNRRVTPALDLNSAAIRFCQHRHCLAGLVFRQGDAENLPFEPNTFDAVINVEASHCYPNFPRFLAQVARVLRPGGHFLYADFRFSDRVVEWEQALAAAQLQLQQMRHINAEVLRGMDRNSPRSLDLIAQHLPKFLHSLGHDFAGVKGSRIYNALTTGELSYRSYCFVKPGNTSI